MVDKLPYMSKSRHLLRCMYIMIKMLQVKNGSEAPSMLRNHKHTTIEASTTRRGFNHSRSKKLINLLLNNRMIWNKGGQDLSWRWWPWTILSKNLLDVMLLDWSKIWKAYQPEKLQMEMMKKLKKLRTLAHQECQPLWLPFLPISAELVETLPPSDFLPLGWA